MSRFTCSCGAILEIDELKAHVCPETGPTVPVHDVPFATGRPPAALGAPPAAPDSAFRPWMALLIGIAVTIPAVLLLKPAPAPVAPPTEELDRLRASLADVEKKLATLKASETSPDRERRIQDLETENERLRRAADQHAQTIRELRLRVDPMPSPPPPAKPAEPAPADPALQALRLSIVDVVAGGDRWYGLAIDAHYVITGLAAVRQATKFTVVYFPDTGDRQRQTSCPATLFAADPVNGLALLAIEAMAPVKPAVLDFNAPLRDGDAVFAPVQRQGAPALEFERRKGKVRNLSVLLNNMDCIEASIPFGMALTGVPLALEDGRVVGLVISAPATAPNTVAAIPVNRIIKFFDRRSDACYRVTGSMDEHELSLSPLFNYDRDSAMKVGVDIVQMAMNPESNQILCLEPKSNGVIVVSPAGKAVSKSIYTGTDPTWIAVAPGQQTFWVGNAASKNFVRINPANLEPIELTLPASYAPRRFFVASGAIFAETGSALLVVSLKDKRESKFQNHLGNGLLLSTRAGGRLVGFPGAFRTASISVDKVLGFAREDARLKPEDYAGRQKLARDFAAEVTLHQPELSGINYPLGNFGRKAFFDHGSKRLYCGQIVFEGDRLDAVVAVNKPRPSSRFSEGALRILESRFPDLHSIQSASPDGKWFATGLHLYKAENFTVRAELPVPSPFSVFSNDSKTLYVYDSWNGYVVPMNIE